MKAGRNPINDEPMTGTFSFAVDDETKEMLERVTKPQMKQVLERMRQHLKKELVHSEIGNDMMDYEELKELFDSMKDK